MRYCLIVQWGVGRIYIQSWGNNQRIMRSRLRRLQANLLQYRKNEMATRRISMPVPKVLLMACIQGKS